VSKDQLCLPEVIRILWALEDLLDDVSKADGQFGDVGADIRAAFASGVKKLKDYHSACRENMLYFASHILDPRTKTSNIKDQYSANKAADIIDELRQYLKAEYPEKTQPEPAPVDAPCPPGISLNQWKLLCRTRNRQ
jgi:hypothetical protein